MLSSYTTAKTRRTVERRLTRRAAECGHRVAGTVRDGWSCAACGARVRIAPDTHDPTYLEGTLTPAYTCESVRSGSDRKQITVGGIPVTLPPGN